VDFALSTKLEKISLSLSADVPDEPPDVKETHTRDYMSNFYLRDGHPRYAIKQISPATFKDPMLLFNGTVDIAIEAKILARMEHPHICKMRAFATTSPFKSGYFILLDRLYDTLEVRLKTWKSRESSLWRKPWMGRGRAKLLTIERLNCSLDLANAMKYMHENNLIYRDLVRYPTSGALFYSIF